MRLDREDYALLPRRLGVEARGALATAARPNAGVIWAMAQTRAFGRRASAARSPGPGALRPPGLPAPRGGPVAAVTGHGCRSAIWLQGDPAAREHAARLMSGSPDEAEGQPHPAGFSDLGEAHGAARVGVGAGSAD